jgi:NTP pyrophosphatase (non-canonical NTP hydrolase)
MQKKLYLCKLKEDNIIMSEIKDLQKRIEQFSEERDWDQFHNGKDLAIGLSIEASELLEAFLWKTPEDVNVDKVKEELADVFNYALQIATKYDLDVKQIVLDKLAKNAAKYPVEKARGVATKYNEL